jgi:hypothetical protein
LPDGASEIFARERVDGWKRIERSSEISFYAQVNSERSIFVMAGLVPATHVFGIQRKT